MFHRGAPMIRAVVFDAVGTVMYPSPPVARVYRAALTRHCERHLSEEEISGVFRRALDERGVQQSLRTDEEGERDFWRQLIHGLCNGHPAFEACFDHLYAHFGESSNWACFDDVADCMTSLSEQNLTIAIASNFDLRLHSVLDGLGPLSGIEHRFVSSQIGFRKPGEQFFNAVCSELLLEPQQVLFVGDDLRNDVFGANQAGCHSAWICRQADRPDSAQANTTRISSLMQVGEVVLSLKEGPS